MYQIYPFHLHKIMEFAASRIDPPTSLFTQSSRVPGFSVAESKTQSFRNKLASATFPDEVEGTGWDHGVPLEDVERLSMYWAEGYDWRVQEA